MIYRNMYRGYSKTKNISIEKVDGIQAVSAAYIGDIVFLYFEADKKDIYPSFVHGDLISFPDGRKWERMNDIFHYSSPQSVAHWQRNFKKSPVFLINRLDSERISEYIYYHFQYQEEFPGDGDRYGIIFSIEDIIVMYLEHPTEKDTKIIPGMLKTKNTPRHKKWEELTNSMFIPLLTKEAKWNKMEIINSSSLLPACFSVS